MSTKIVDSVTADTTGAAYSVPADHQNYRKGCTIDFVINGPAGVQIEGSPDGNAWLPIGEAQRYSTSMRALLPAYARAVVNGVGENTSVDVSVAEPVTLVA